MYTYDIENNFDTRTLWGGHITNFSLFQQLAVF